MTLSQYLVYPKGDNTLFVTERTISDSPQVITGSVYEWNWKTGRKELLFSDSVDIPREINPLFHDPDSTAKNPKTSKEIVLETYGPCRSIYIKDGIIVTEGTVLPRDIEGRENLENYSSWSSSPHVPKRTLVAVHDLSSHVTKRYDLTDIIGKELESGIIKQQGYQLVNSKNEQLPKGDASRSQSVKNPLYVPGVEEENTSFAVRGLANAVVFDEEGIKIDYSNGTCHQYQNLTFTLSNDPTVELNTNIKDTRTGFCYALVVRDGRYTRIVSTNERIETSKGLVFVSQEQLGRLAHANVPFETLNEYEEIHDLEDRLLAIEKGIGFSVANSYVGVYMPAIVKFVDNQISPEVAGEIIRRFGSRTQSLIDTGRAVELLAYDEKFDEIYFFDGITYSLDPKYTPVSLHLINKGITPEQARVYNHQPISIVDLVKAGITPDVANRFSNDVAANDLITFVRNGINPEQVISFSRFIPSNELIAFVEGGIAAEEINPYYTHQKTRQLTIEDKVRLLKQQITPQVIADYDLDIFQVTECERFHELGIVPESAEVQIFKDKVRIRSNLGGWKRGSSFNLRIGPEAMKCALTHGYDGHYLIDNLENHFGVDKLEILAKEGIIPTLYEEGPYWNRGRVLVFDDTTIEDLQALKTVETGMLNLYMRYNSWSKGWSKGSFESFARRHIEAAHLNITPDEVRDYEKVNVSVVEIPALIEQGITPDLISRYAKFQVGVSKITEFLEAEVTPEEIAEYNALGINSARYMFGTKKAGLTLGHIRRYNELGFKPDDIKPLFDAKVSPENAKVGNRFGWEIATICKIDPWIPDFVYGIARRFIEPSQKDSTSGL